MNILRVRITEPIHSLFVHCGFVVFFAAFGLLCHHCFSCYKTELLSHEVIFCFSSRREPGRPMVYVHRWEGILGTFRHRLYTNNNFKGSL